MSSQYLFVFLLLALNLIVQVLYAVPTFKCEIETGGICIKRYDMSTESVFENETVGYPVYRLQAEDTDVGTEDIKYEIISTEESNLPPGINPANGIDYMTVDEFTGEVRFITPIDYEVYKQVRPTWRLTTRATGDRREDFVIVYIDNWNDIEPSFINEPYISDPIPENTTIGSIVYSNVEATDGDDDSPQQVDGPIVYYLASTYEDFNCEQDKFRIDLNSGDVILNEELSYLGQTQYTVCIEADDQGYLSRGGPLTTGTTVRLSVEDVQGEKPNFVGLPYLVNVPEDEPVYSSLLLIIANDGDTGVPDPNGVVISLEDGPGADMFYINDTYNEASLILVKELDRETVASYTLTVQARENDNTQKEENIVTNTTVFITVYDVNDEPPVFDSDDNVITFLQENSPTNTPLNLGITVEDRDSDQYNEFTLSLDGAGDAFKLQQTVITGIGTVDIRVNDSKLLDYEIQKEFNFLVVASEDGFDDVAIDVTVILTDINDNTPVFNKTRYNCNVPENSPSGTNVCQVTATDEDSAEFSSITYSLEGSGNDRFDINDTSGQVFVTSNDPEEDLNAETQGIFFLTVLANDGERVATTLLEITLDDVNDEPPVFNPNRQQTTIDEFDNVTRIGEVLLTVSATDGDISEQYRELTYLISGGNEDGKFSINSISGEISLNDTIDYEADIKEYNLEIMAINTAVPHLNGSATVTVKILDVNDNPPIFEESIYMVNVSEDAAVDSLVITLTATDADEEQNAKIDYRILSGSQDQFRIVVNNGELLVNDPLDRESVQNYILEVVATDRGISQLEGYCTVFVNITDVNDVDPTFEDIQPQSIPENYTTGPSSVFYTVTAYDPDDTADLRYSIQNNSMVVLDENGVELDNTEFLDQFGIVETTGGLYVNEELDREIAVTYILTLIVEDYNAKGDEPQMDVGEITITVLDVNDNAPTFKEVSYAFPVEEHEAEGTVISTEISATDPDLDLNGEVVYSTVGGSGFEYAEINPDTGVLTATGDPQFDRELHSVLYVVVRASDMGNPPNYADTNVTLNVVDINDQPPVFDGTIPGEVEIPEDLSIGSLVLEVTATDQDTDHGDIFYAITAGNIGEKFIISDNRTGNITVNGELDREDFDTYVLTITASDKPLDQQPQQDVIEVEVKLTDVNDIAPEITSPEFDNGVTVLETEEIGQSILFVAAEDGDQENTDNSAIDFYIGGGNGTDLFGIDAESGEITIISSLQALSAEYTLIVVVRDRGMPPLESNRTLFITVVDVNDDTPRILYPEDNDVKYVPEDFGPGYVLTIEGEDLDKGNNGKITYEFVTIGGNDYEKFTLDNSTGELSINEMTDRETQEIYLLIIRGANLFSDDDQPRFSEPVTFTIQVNDTNDNEPEFREPGTEPEPRLLDVGENLGAGTLVGSVAVAYDEDGPGNDQIFYFIVDRTDDNLFSLDKYTGEITLTTELNREESMEYILIVNATSNENFQPVVDNFASPTRLEPGPDDTSLLEVVIAVIDDNDNGPIFTEPLFTAGVQQNQRIDENIIQITATDADGDSNSQMEFNFIGEQLNCRPDIPCAPDPIPKFAINKTTGMVFTIRDFDSDDRGWYEIGVRVHDPTKEGDDFYVDEAEISIYLITDQDQVRVNFGVSQDEVRTFEVEFRQFFANIVEADEAYLDVAINQDALEVDGNTTRSYMIIHGVDSSDNRVIDAAVLVDKFDEATPDQKEVFLVEYSVRDVYLVAQPLPPNGFTDIQWIFFSFAVICLFLLVIMFIGFVFARNDYKRKIRAAEAGMVTSSAKTVNPTLIPGTNKFAKEASNPMFDEKNHEYEELPDIEEGESANSMTGSEEQEVTVNMYNDDDDHRRASDSAGSSNKLLLTLLEELENSKTEKHGLDNIAVTDV